MTEWSSSSSQGRCYRDFRESPGRLGDITLPAESRPDPVANVEFENSPVQGDNPTHTDERIRAPLEQVVPKLFASFEPLPGESDRRHV